LPIMRRMTSASRSRIAVFTSLDGTLLDPATFDPGFNREVVRRLQRRQIDVIPVTVMTFAEASAIAAQLDLCKAMIIENGGAIAWRTRGAWKLEPIGVAVDAYLAAIREIEDRSGAQLAVYSALPEADAAKLSGRRGTMLSHSLLRSFSEPFVIETGSFDAVRRAARAIGFEVRRGRRFLYLCRGGDVAAAFARVRDHFGFDLTIGIGGSMADLELLQCVDVASVLASPEGGNGRNVWQDAVNDCLLALRYSAPEPIRS
jgi:predicted mannosyl-3-phosphoglycerate phosphatase (HAD superfamily)